MPRENADEVGARMRRLSIVFPTLPPVIDGIGDYTAHLAAQLAHHAEVCILTAQDHWEKLPGVTIQLGYSLKPRRGMNHLVDAVLQDPPDWLVIQYNPFSYGQWGLNPHLPHAVWRIRKQLPRLRIALMVHEPFMPAHDFKSALMSLWQRWQLWTLGRAADVVFFSISPWVRAFRSWFPKASVLHLPVGSNVPRIPTSRVEARSRAGVDHDAFVVGIFGGAHPSRLLPFICAALEALANEVEKLCVLYVGTAGTRVRQALGNVPLVDAGPLSPDGVSQHFAAMDLYLAPFRKGVSTRRGSFMVGLQHGVPTVSTCGVHTDEMLLTQGGTAFILTSDDDSNAFASAVVRLARDESRRARLGEAGQSFFDASFTWPRIAERMQEAMAARSEMDELSIVLPRRNPSDA